MLAKTMGAEITLLHVIAEPVCNTSPGHITIMGFSDEEDVNAIQLDTIDGLKKTSRNFLDKSKHFLGDDTIQTLIKDGDYAESILETAKKCLHIYK